MQIFQLRFVAYQEERPIQDPYLFSGFWWLEDYTWIFLSILLNFIGRPQYVLLSKSFAPTLFTPGPYIDQKATDLQHSCSFVIFNDPFRSDKNVDQGKGIPVQSREHHSKS